MIVHDRGCILRFCNFIFAQWCRVFQAALHSAAQVLGCHVESNECVMVGDFLRSANANDPASAKVFLEIHGKHIINVIS